ncbi:MAG: hypothetical protein NUW01_14165 [Gemmatimonadaceae bacterium]|nr:hypothetical protein [Gemmatimonadaceae bacterium]
MATTTLLTLKGDFWRHQGLQWTSTATGGAAGYLTDSTLINLATDDFPASTTRRQLRITSGSADGDLRQVVDINREAGTIRPSRAFSASVANTDAYELWGSSIYGGQPLTDLFNDVLRSLRPKTQTRLSVEHLQRRYAVTTIADAEADIRAVWMRRMNNVVGGDYREARVQGWRVDRRAGNSTPTTHLRFDAPLLISPTTTLNGALNDAATTITVAATADVPSPGYDFSDAGRLVIDNELIDYTGTTATTFTGCTRGVENSTAAAHDSGASVDVATGTYYFVEHQSALTAFTTDASTVDAIYRDWIAWEALFEFARQRSIQPGADRAYWSALIRRVSDELLQLRPRYMPLEPTTIRAVDFA